MLIKFKNMYKIIYLLFVCNAIAVLCQNADNEDYPEEDCSEVLFDVHGRRITPELAQVLAVENSSWHLLPWRRSRTYVNERQILDLEKCTNDSGENFPEDIFTDEQLLQGAIILHIFAVIYSFSLLAVVCNSFFIPAVECICEDLNLSKDVAAATFMASATSTPELFANLMGTFVTDSDLGIGTIVGSALFNAMGVTAIGALAARKPIKMERGPITRDSIIYCFNVAILVVIVWDDEVLWYESTVLLILYLLYFIFMFRDKIREKLCKRPTNNEIIVNCENGSIRGLDNPVFTLTNAQIKNDAISEGALKKPDNSRSFSTQVRKNLWEYPADENIFRRVWFVYSWPIKLILIYTIPSPKTVRFLYPVTFVLCIVWIGLISYFVSWMVTVIGTLFNLPDSVMGLTFLAYGGCLPEACSLFIVTRKGEGDMGISNSLGANSLAILFSLGIPWFSKAMWLRWRGLEGSITIDSSGMNYIVLSLIPVVIVLYVIFFIGKFYLQKKTGVVIFIFYIFFATMYILTETGVFGDVGIPPC